MGKVKAGPKILAVAVIVGAGVYGAHWYTTSHGDAKMVSSVPQAQQQLADFKETSAPESNKPSATPVAGMPSTQPAHVDGKKIRLLTIPWNAVMGLAFANGGSTTTEGSLMAKEGVNLQIERQDDYSKMQEELVACANQLSKGGKTCSNGSQFAIIMGDGAPAFLAGLNPQLAKLGSDYQAEIIASVGRSNGEDAFLVPPAVKDDPKQAAGLLVSGVLKDGDWNLALFWAAQNEVCNNPDPTTYDPDCLNWVGTKDFVEAGEKYIQGACEERSVVQHGKKTGKTQKVCVGASVVWTPVDVSIAKKKGGLVPAISTRENASQMPATIVGIRKFDQDNHDVVVKMIRAALEGGDQVKRNSAALKRGADAEAAIFKEETGSYWAKYARGVDEEDATGNVVHLGGSKVFNLADNIRYFGLDKDGSANAYSATYTLFGDIAKQQYPADMPSYPEVSTVLNLAFVQELAASSSQSQTGKADAPSFDNIPENAPEVAHRSWHINFDTGKASFGQSATGDLKELLSTLVVASDTTVDIVGHTDNAGSPTANMALSQARADAVRKYLEKNAPGNFPAGRVHVSAKGQTEPVADNSTPTGKAKNRRVDIVLRSTK